jgi:hypothetical protein
MWISPEFGVEVAEWVYRFISGDMTLVHDLVDRHEAANPGAQVRATVTTAGADIDAEVVALLHQDNAIAQENEQLKVRIVEVKRNAETREEELIVLQHSVEDSEKRAQELESQVNGLEQDCITLRQEAVQSTTQREELESDRNHKRRRLNEVEGELAQTRVVGQMLFQHHLITRADLEQYATQEEFDGFYTGDQTREQRDAGSKPVRYVALRNVCDGSNGEENRLIRDLNRNTFDSLGQNLTKYALAHQPSRTQKMQLIRYILDLDEFDADRERTPYSSVSWRCLLYKQFKLKHHLQYSTNATLRTMHGLTRRANTWFAERGLSLEFHLTEQRDLERILGLEQHTAIGVAVKQCDIRHFLAIRPHLTSSE